MDNGAETYKNILLNFDKVGADEFFSTYINEQRGDELIEAVQLALVEIGDEWENETIALSQLYVGGTISEELINRYFQVEDVEGEDANIAIVTLGDFHVLGKKILKSVLQTHKIKILDFGQGLEPKLIIEKLKKHPVELLLVSVLMYPTALEVKKLTDLIIQTGIQTKIMVGGAPFNFDKNLWKKVGADAMGTGPNDALKYINDLKIK